LLIVIGSLDLGGGLTWNGCRKFRDYCRDNRLYVAPVAQFTPVDALPAATEPITRDELVKATGMDAEEAAKYPGMMSVVALSPVDTRFRVIICRDHAQVQQGVSFRDALLRSEGNLDVLSAYPKLVTQVTEQVKMLQAHNAELKQYPFVSESELVATPSTWTRCSSSGLRKGCGCRSWCTRLTW